jgi:hypothetical protein
MKTFSIRKKLLMASSIIFLFFVAFVIYEFAFSITGTPTSDKVVFSDAMEWNYQLIYTYHGHDYSVTKNIIPPSFVGWKIETEGWNGPS